MPTPDGWLVLAIRTRRRPSLWLRDKLAGGVTVGSRPAEGQVTRKGFKGLADILAGIASGVYTGNVFGTILDGTGGTYSTGNIACTQANAAGDTITFTWGTLTVVLTEGASGVNGFARGSSNTTCAANLAACINAHPVLGPLVTAVGSVGNCGLTSRVPSLLVQSLAMSTNDATAFAFTQLTGAVLPTARMFFQQFWANRRP
jgi:hypothetical protein